MAQSTKFLRLLVTFVAVVELLETIHLAEAGFVDRFKKCGKNKKSDYEYDGTLARKMMAYSATAYVKDHALIRTWSCSLCQENLAGFEPLTVKEDELLRLSYYTGYDPALNANVLVFRGSRDKTDRVSQVLNWIVNLSAFRVPPKDLGGKKKIPGYVHYGFYRAFKRLQTDVLTNIETLKAAHPDAELYVTGHSLGGALAVMATIDIRVRGIYTNPIMINFGTPRVGNSCFGQYFSKKVPRRIRVAHPKDPVTKLPPPWLFYRHVGRKVLDTSTNDHRSYLGFDSISSRRRRSPEPISDGSSGFNSTLKQL
eukprot:scpid75268/ scgid21252/ Mono- and diacylglycerol lipase; Mono- and diacylglycerol lipase